MKSILREYIKLSLLKEAAQQPTGLALGIYQKNSDDRQLVLWDPNELLKLVTAYKEKHKINYLPKSAYVEFLDILDKWIVGTLTLAPQDNENHWHGSEVVASAAKKGFGPAMYDIAMNVAGTIYSDRTSVSSSAKNIWHHYYSDRGDVKVLPFDDIKNPKTPSPEDDGNIDKHPNDKILNAAYKGNGISASKLISKHNLSLQLLANETDWDTDIFDKLILNAGMEYFHNRYFG